ncbi:hypothetical protein SAMN05892883_2331 [Jatrophihabitans sp. GAS493]|uniref:anti-sigma factor family protein n=1 Tax=Jatrophihabitans sp. GAS493 TaxID=1907575 RepID=UPI000BB8C4E2|nr:hypothetical protein [Jatrophihabitans sp. GAS493]SOD73026.1 hypothetical protein SAMN05892883_2331 [Jatrophihabitans sp. GAS493]
MNFAPQHLSDEAVAACADSALNAPARLRAERHLAGCAECRRAVQEQQEAARVLRRAVAPALPSGLMQRLRDVPQTTELPPNDFTLSPEGNAVFPTFKPSGSGSRASAPPPPPHHSVRRHSRALLFTAAAFVSVSAASVAVAAVPSQVAQDAPAPSAPARYLPAGYSNVSYADPSSGDAGTPSLPSLVGGGVRHA